MVLARALLQPPRHQVPKWCSADAIGAHAAAAILPSCGGASTHQTRCWAVEASTDPSAAGESSRAGLVHLAVRRTPSNTLLELKALLEQTCHEGAEGLKELIEANLMSVWCKVRVRRSRLSQAVRTCQMLAHTVRACAESREPWTFPVV